MADTKISQLTTLAAASIVDGDWVPVVDTSDTSMAATGTTKKVDAGSFAYQGEFVGARVYNSANISVANATTVTVTFDSERYDTNALHSTVSLTGRLTAPVAGKYLIHAQLAFGVMPTALCQIFLVLNGATTIGYEVQASVPSPNATRLNVMTVYALAATDYVEVKVHQDSGGTEEVLTLSNYSPEFSMTLLSNP